MLPLMSAARRRASKRGAAKGGRVQEMKARQMSDEERQALDEPTDWMPWKKVEKADAELALAAPMKSALRRSFNRN